MPDNTSIPNPNSRKVIRLEKIKEFYAETGTLIRVDIEHLIGQAEWALRLSEAGEALNQSSSKYIEQLEESHRNHTNRIEALQDEVACLQDYIDAHQPKEA